MPDFAGTDWIIVQPRDDEVPYRFPFSACSGVDSNDGSLPFGDSISSVVVTAHTEAGVDVTSQLIDSTSVSGNTVIVVLQWPSNGAGIYHLTFAITTTLGSVIEFDYNRIRATDK